MSSRKPYKLSSKLPDKKSTSQKTSSGRAQQKKNEDENYKIEVPTDIEPIGLLQTGIFGSQNQENLQTGNDVYDNATGPFSRHQ